MGWEILEQTSGDEERACFWCNTADVAFGPVFYGGRLEAEAFQRWLACDPRSMPTAELMDLYAAFKRGEESP